MDFYKIKERPLKNGITEIYPDFLVKRSKDLMVRGRSFYAVWDETLGLWSTDEYDVQVLVDKDLYLYRNERYKESNGNIKVRSMSDFSSTAWKEFRRYLNHVSDNATQLDKTLTFLDTKVERKDFVSRRLSYNLAEGSRTAYDLLMDTLYDPEERQKLEWAVGAIIAGDAANIQKFIVLYGEAGAGKSTFLNIVQKLFKDYYTTFEAKALTSSSNSFSTEVFKDNPLVAIQHDGDLSRIDDNTKLNSIISHEPMTVNEKYKPSYTMEVSAFLFMATNQPVKISDAKSGIIRRLIDVYTSGRKLPTKKYLTAISQIDFELGAIAHHCLSVYRSMGKDYYSFYKPMGMIFRTDIFFNFVESEYHLFKLQNGCSLTQAYSLYKEYMEESGLGHRLPRYKFRDELKNYFNKFSDVARINGKQVRSYYEEFLTEKFTMPEQAFEVETPNALVLDQTKSLFDTIASEYQAQYATRQGIPERRWVEVNTKTSDLNTKRIHFVRLPKNHIVIDFDLRDDDGEKSPELNLEAASKWPATYAEYSKSRAGIHLHYIYLGDPKDLSPLYAEGIEIKVFRGASSLRRRLSKCNNIPIAEIKEGLPLREKRAGGRMIDFKKVKSELGLRRLVERNLRKEIHPATKPSIDFIKKILDDAYDSGLEYDLTSLRPSILSFAMGSTNQGDACIKAVAEMKFKSENLIEEILADSRYKDDAPIAFFDVEVFPNLLLVCWKYLGNTKIVSMVNPTPQEIEDILRLKLVGFNCRRYDNHILYARYLGFTLDEIYALSQRIVNRSRNAYFREAYNLSYTDVFDFSSKKQSLKKFQIELGIHHKELGFPWDEPVEKSKWPMVIEYCENDVVSLEKVFEARREDFNARLILSELSGLTPNATTQQHTARIIFGDDKKPQEKFVYTDLSDLFPGYKFDRGKSFYKGEEPGEGGYVYAEPGMYSNVVLLDIASMHPTSLELLNLFGPYTKNFSQIKAARLAIKHHNFDAAKGMLNGILEPYLADSKSADSLAHALKIVINIVYGLTSAKFDNPFKDDRNMDNIVAKRGALFMIDLKRAVQKKGFVVAHCKTDSIKIPEATQEIIDFVFEFGKQYGYEFEHEATYDSFCLVNDAVYVARYSWSIHKEEIGKWTATGAQYIHPYVFKTLFSKERIMFGDLCETKSVTTAMYLDFDERLSEGEHNYQFIGKSGLFCPILPGNNAGRLYRKKGEKYYSVTGTKDHRWLEAEHVMAHDMQDVIDYEYHERLVKKAKANISQFGDFDAFIS